jgi:hypothetical protein
MNKPFEYLFTKQSHSENFHHLNKFSLFKYLYVEYFLALLGPSMMFIESKLQVMVTSVRDQNTWNAFPGSE